MKGNNKHIICNISEKNPLYSPATINPVMTLNVIRKKAINGMLKCLKECLALIPDLRSMNVSCSVFVLLAKTIFVISPCRGNRKNHIIMVSWMKNFRIATTASTAAVLRRMSLRCLFIAFIASLKNLVKLTCHRISLQLDYTITRCFVKRIFGISRSLFPGTLNVSNSCKLIKGNI